jgi:hypothetical protein
MRNYLLNLVLFGAMTVACAAKKEPMKPLDVYEAGGVGGTYDQTTGTLTLKEGADAKKVADWLAQQLYNLSIQHQNMVVSCQREIETLNGKEKPGRKRRSKSTAEVFKNKAPKEPKEPEKK